MIDMPTSTWHAYGDGDVIIEEDEAGVGAGKILSRGHLEFYIPEKLSDGKWILHHAEIDTICMTLSL